MRRQHLTKLARRVAAAVALGVVFGAALLVALLLHLDTPPARRLIVHRANDLFEDLFRGKLIIGQLDHLGFGTVRASNVLIIDPRGRRVVEAKGVYGELDVVHLLQSLRAGRVDVRLTTARVHDAVVRLERDPSGLPTLALAFELRHPPQPGGGGPPATVRLERAFVHHAWVHGNYPLDTLDADVSEVSGRIGIEEGNVALDIHDSDVRARAMPSGANPDGRLRGALRVRTNAPLVAHAKFDGRVGPASLSTTGELDGSSFELLARIYPVSPEGVRALLGDAPVHAPVSGTVRAAGDFETIRLSAKLRVGAAPVAVRGAIRPAQRRLELELSARQLDPASFLPQAPHASVDVDGAGWATFARGGAPRGELRATAQAFSLDGFSVPPTEISARLRDGIIDGRLLAREPGAPTEVDFQVALSPSLDEFREATFSADASVSDLARVRRFGALGRGPAELQARGVLSPKPLRISATLSGRFQQIAIQGVSARDVSVQGELSGRVEAPTVVGSANGHDVEIAGRRFERATIRARGDTSRLSVTARLVESDATLDARTVVGFQDGRVEARDLVVSDERDEKEVRVSAGSIRYERGTVTAERVRLEGAGSLELSGRLGERGGVLKATGRDVELDRIASMLGIAPIEGTASFDVDARRRADGHLDGRIRFRGQGIRAFGLSPSDVRVDIVGDSGIYDGEAIFLAEGPAHALVSLRRVALPALRFDREVLERATGELRVDARAALAKLEALPWIREIVLHSKGEAVLSARVARDEIGVAPDVDVYVATKCLGTREGGEAPSWLEWAAARDTDVQLRGRLEGNTGRTLVHARTIGKAGPIADATLLATVPADEMIAEPRAAGALLRRLPVVARLRVLPRRLETLPGPAERAGLTGTLSINAVASGTLEEPRVHAYGHLRGFRIAEERESPPLDINAELAYQPAGGHLWVDAKESNRTVLTARSELKGSMLGVLSGEPHWSAAAFARMSHFPLANLSWLAGRELKGRASGQVDLVGYNDDAKLVGKLGFSHLEVAGSKIDNATAQVALENGRLQAKVGLAQPKGRGTMRLDAPVRWGARPVPEVVPGAPVNAALEANDLDISFLLPFVDSTLSTLEGRLNADIELAENKVSGRMELRDGVVQVPATGQELRGIKARAVARGSVLEVERVSGRGLTGRFEATGRVVFDGITPAQVQADVRIPKGDEIPLTIQGVNMGTAWGRAQVDVRPPRDGAIGTVRASIPRLHVELPPNPKRSVQPLEEAPHVEIGVHHTSGRFEPLPVQLVEERPEPEATSIWRVEVALGRDVWIRQSTKMRLRVRGTPVLVSDGQARMTGQVEVAEGWIDVLGKRFDVEEAVVTFQGDPDNPTVVARARWDSPEDVRVYARYTGRLKDGELALSSEPPYTEGEILSLLLFGTPEGSVGATPGAEEGGGVASGAAGVGGGVATAGLNRALSRLSEVEITTRVDTSGPGPRPEVAVQITKRVAVGVAYNFGSRTAVTTNPDTVFGTVVLRLPKKWQLEATVGDAGSSILDLVWRHRY